MRIAYVCADSGVPTFGCKGSSIHVQEVIRAFRRKGASVELYASRFEGAAPDDMVDLPCIDLPRGSKSEGHAREQMAIDANEYLRCELGKRGHYDLVYERYSLWSHAAMTWARGLGIPGLLEVNSPLIEEQVAYRALYDRPSAEKIASLAFNAAHGLIAVSSGVGSYLKRRGVPSDRIQVVPNGVNLDRFANTSVAATHGEFTVGFVGTMKPWHGVQILLQAAAMAHRNGVPLRLLIVGDGPERGEIESQLRFLGLQDAAELRGSVPPESIPALLARMNIAVAPYPELIDFYFSPLKIMEYMAAGRPVIASRIGDIADLITDDITGLLCSPGDTVALSNAISRLYFEPETRARLGSSARAYAGDHLGWDRVVDRILAVSGAVPEASLRAVAC